MDHLLRRIRTTRQHTADLTHVLLFRRAIGFDEDDQASEQVSCRRVPKLVPPTAHDDKVCQHAGIVPITYEIQRIVAVRVILKRRPLEDLTKQIPSPRCFTVVLAFRVKDHRRPLIVKQGAQDEMLAFACTRRSHGQQVPFTMVEEGHT